VSVGEGTAADDELADAERRGDALARRWTRIVPGAALVAVVALVAVRTWSALVANHPAYPVALLAGLVLGVWLLVTGIRPRPRPEQGRVRTTSRVLAAAAGVGLAAALLWSEPFVASPAALDALAGGSGATVTDSRTATVYEPAGEPLAGLVLYGGARVDPRAYAVLAEQIAAQGYRVVVLKCPFDLQVLCPDAAAAHVDDSMPWAVGGHSLGGVAASSYAGSHPEVDGLVLWASFPVSDISGRTDLETTSITGSADGHSTPAKVDERRPLLPAGTEYVEIPGAIHSFFGDYGLQPGDGTPTIDRETAQQQIVAATVALLERISDPSA
jgi:predicted alpha/beta-hydrolase family hydrolase